jgi:glycosyltransferase involved in cell wall biosynthesis
MAANRSSCSVLLAVPWFDLAGSSVLLKEVFAPLKTRGFVVTAIATNRSEGLVNESGLPLYESYTKDCFNLPALFEGRGDFAQFVEYVISSRKVNLLFLAGSSIVYENLPRLKKAFPHVVVFDQLYNKVGHIANNRKYGQYIDLTIVPNEEVRDHLIELGESRDRVCLIPHGVDTEKFDSTSLAYAAAFRNRRSEGFTFGYLGRLSPEKRPQDIVQLASMLPQCQFLIVGCGPMGGFLQEEIRSRGLAQRVHMKDRIDNVMEFYAGIDALVVSSEIEGLPLVLLEAMALRLPVIATKVGRIPLAVSHGDNGFLYKTGDIEQLRQLACKLMELPTEDKKRIGENARATILKEYNIGKCAESYYRVIMTSLGLSDLENGE